MKEKKTCESADAQAIYAHTTIVERIWNIFISNDAIHHNEGLHKVAKSFTEKCTKNRYE